MLNFDQPEKLKSVKKSELIAVHWYEISPQHTLPTSLVLYVLYALVSGNKLALDTIHSQTFEQKFMWSQQFLTLKSWAVWVCCQQTRINSWQVMDFELVGEGLGNPDAVFSSSSWVRDVRTHSHTVSSLLNTACVSKQSSTISLCRATLLSSWELLLKFCCWKLPEKSLAQNLCFICTIRKMGARRTYISTKQGHLLVWLRFRS